MSSFFDAESKDLIFSGNFTGSHNGADYDVSYKCSHDIDSTYEDDIRDYVKEKISDGDESFEMTTGFYDGEIEIEGTVTWVPNCASCNNPIPKDEYGEPDDVGDGTGRGSCCACVYCYEEMCSGNCEAKNFNAPTGYTERGPRPFYGNPRKMALDRWGNRRYIRRRKDGTYMKNVDVKRSLAMDRRRQSQTWAPSGYRDQGDGSPSLLVRLLDMFKGVDEEILMAESYLMCADCDTYSSECGCHNSESDAYIFAYNDGHSDARRDGSYRPSTTDKEITSFKKIFKQ